MTSFSENLNTADGDIQTSAEFTAGLGDGATGGWFFWIKSKVIGERADAAEGDATVAATLSARLASIAGAMRLAATGILKAEDAAHASGDAGVMVLAVRRDTSAASSGTTGDYEPFQTDSLGRLRVCPPMDRNGATRIRGASGNVANASAVATLAAGGAAVMTYITGFAVTAAGATAGVVVNVTVAGTTGGSLTYVFTAPTGVTTAADPLIVEFADPVPASALNTAITVTLPALGAGNTHAAVVALGYQK